MATEDGPTEQRALGPTQPLDYRGARHLIQLALLIIVIWFLVLSLQSVLLLFAVVILLAIVLNGPVVWLQRWRIPRGLSVAVVLLAAFAFAGVVAALIIPVLFGETRDLIQRAPRIWHEIGVRIDTLAASYPALRGAMPPADQIAATIGNQAGAATNILLKSTLGFVGGIFSAIFAVLLLVFVLGDPQPLVLGYLALVPERYRDAARRTLARFMEQVSAWARGVIISGTITGLSTGLLLWLIGVQPALVFAALTFLGQLIPPIGPMIMSVPALLVALSMGATKFWFTLGIILFVQQVETTVLLPFIFGRGMRLNSALILFFTLATGLLFGVAGALVAIPCAALVQIVLDEFYLRPRRLDYATLNREAEQIVQGRGSPEPPSSPSP
ncbi:MAG: AI-2E family transporter [Verrucomicrobiota bacterium]